ncbi:MAG: dUTP diphosphatase [Verrucomicrobia bacterium]|nr:dUTP diphosphatase [Verrucomicrobiota bacterium]
MANTPEKYFVHQPVVVKVQTKNPDLIPLYATEGAAGADLRADLIEPMVIPKQSSRLVPTGLFLEIPAGYEVQVRPRSGLALKHLVTVLNSPGTIDSDYRGEVMVILMNHSENEFSVLPGMRIAQVVVAPVVRAQFVLADSLATSERAAGGFGHTGLA